LSSCSRWSSWRRFSIAATIIRVIATAVATVRVTIIRVAITAAQPRRWSGWRRFSIATAAIRVTIATVRVVAAA
jgi:hypothetical protein